MASQARASELSGAEASASAIAAASGFIVSMVCMELVRSFRSLPLGQDRGCCRGFAAGPVVALEVLGPVIAIAGEGAVGDGVVAVRANHAGVVRHRGREEGKRNQRD